MKPNTKKAAITLLQGGLFFCEMFCLFVLLLGLLAWFNHEAYGFPIRDINLLILVLLAFFVAFLLLFGIERVLYLKGVRKAVNEPDLLASFIVLFAFWTILRDFLVGGAYTLVVATPFVLAMAFLLVLLYLFLLVFILRRKLQGVIAVALAMIALLVFLEMGLQPLKREEMVSITLISLFLELALVSLVAFVIRRFFHQLADRFIPVKRPTSA